MKRVRWQRAAPWAVVLAGALVALLLSSPRWQDELDAWPLALLQHLALAAGAVACGLGHRHPQAGVRHGGKLVLGAALLFWAAGWAAPLADLWAWLIATRYLWLQV